MSRNGQRFEYSFWAKASFTGLFFASPAVFFVLPEYALYYLGLLIFLGLGLRPILVRLGIDVFFSNLQGRIEEKNWQPITEQRRREVEAAAEVKRIKSSHVRDPRLPPNW